MSRRLRLRRRPRPHRAALHVRGRAGRAVHLEQDTGHRARHGLSAVCAGHPVPVGERARTSGMSWLF